MYYHYTFYTEIQAASVNEEFVLTLHFYSRNNFPLSNKLLSRPNRSLKEGRPQNTSAC